MLVLLVDTMPSILTRSASRQKRHLKIKRSMSVCYLVTWDMNVCGHTPRPYQLLPVVWKLLFPWFHPVTMTCTALYHCHLAHII